MVGLPTHAWVKNSLSFKFLALSKEGLLQSCGSRLMETDMQDQLLLGHGISIAGVLVKLLKQSELWTNKAMRFVVGLCTSHRWT